jgi:hypothetical protein
MTARLLIALALAAGCRGEPSSRAPRSRAAAPVTVQVKVDRRVELVSILFRLAGVREYGMASPTLPYGLAVDYHFGPFRDHPAVAATRRVHEEAGIAYDAPMSLAVHLDERLRAPAFPPPSLDARWHAVAFGDYVAEVRRFAAASRADQFFAGQAAYYRKVEDRFRRLLEREKPVAWFDSLFGARAGARYVLVPGLLTGPANYGPHVERDGGASEIYSIVSLEDVDAEGLPRPGQFTVELVVHELAHSYVNPLVDRHADDLEVSMSRIYSLVREDMRRQAYGSWKIMAYESLVRAVTQLYVRQRHGDDAADRLEREDESNSFYWTGELARELAGRRAKTLEGEMPRVVAFFDQLAARYADGIPLPPFRGPINAVFKRDVALVEPSPKASKALAAYLAQVKKTIYPAEASLPGADRELAVRAQVLYGSPATSPLVASLVTGSGWQVDGSGIAVAGQRFEGGGLVLIACRPHPRDPTLPVLLYTAARDDDIVNVNAVFHGPDDWVVARRGADGRFTIVAKGDFPRGRDGSWRLAGPASR